MLSVGNVVKYKDIYTSKSIKKIHQANSNLNKDGIAI